MSESFIEIQPWGYTSYTVIPGSRISFQTEKAKIDLITNPHFGRMLFIDGVLQSATSDEHIYHKTLVREGIGYVPCPRILVLGGAEGATLREIQNLDAEINLGVREIVMVDWDEQLVRHMDENEPWSQGSFDDERLELHFKDVTEILDTCQEAFNTIIIDLLDPYTDDDRFWLINVVKKCMTLTVPGARMILNCGSSRVDAEKIRDALNDYVIETKIICIHVPSFMEPWYLLFLHLS